MSKLILTNNGQIIREVPLTGNRLKIGKLAENDLVLDMSSLSREHCQIFFHQGRYYIQDLNSKNGTYVNGVRITREVMLQDGAVVQLGSYQLLYVEETVQPVAGPSQKKAARPQAKSPAGGGAKIPADLKRRVHEQLLTDLDLKKLNFSEQSDEEIRVRTLEVVTKIVLGMGREVSQVINPQLLIKDVVDEAVGLGPLEDLLEDEEVDEIMVNNWDRVFVERSGKITLSDKQFSDNQQVVNVIRRILAPIGRRIDETSPMVDARLKDGSRVNAIIHPLALTGPTLTIRKFAKEPFVLRDLVGFGTLTSEMGEFLQICVKNRKNILISGGTGSGKTTLLNVVSGFIPEGERIVTIEDAAELRLSQEHVVSLEARPPNIEGSGAIPIQKLVVNSLRMRPDRIIVGECRYGEALDMLQAMNTGHDGSLTTVHANSPRDAISRLETLVLMAGIDLPSKAIREQIASGINIIVQIARISDGTRKVVKISEITGMEGEIITLADVFVFEQTGYDARGSVTGVYKAMGHVPKFIHDLQLRGINVDVSIFSAKPTAV